MIPIKRIRWRPCYRIIPSRFPPISLFDEVTDPADLDAVIYIEGLTNPRLRQEVGDLNLVPERDRVSGPGTTPIMAAFTHLNPDGSRFSDGTYGVYYAGHSQETAIRETVFHREKFMRYSNEPPMELGMRVYQSNLDGRLHDLREHKDSNPEWFDPDDYTTSRKLGIQLRAEDSHGICYPSVRHEGGECIAIFRPRVLSPCIQGTHLGYLWDGDRISKVIEKKVIIEMN